MYRKFKADKIFTGYEILEGSYILITDREGLIIDLIEEPGAGDGIEIFTGLLSPGFINCHCHLELSHLKGFIPKHTGLVDFVFKVVTERHFEEGQILEAIENAENEMLRNGIVAVGDICNNIFTLPQKQKRRLFYHNFIEASGFTPAVTGSRFQRAAGLYESYMKISPANSIVPHAPYSVSPEMFRMINGFPGNHLLTIHNQEINDENIFFKRGEGDLLRMYEKMKIDISFFNPTDTTSLQFWLPYFTNKQSIILVHNVATSEQDLEFSKLQTSNFELQTFFCLCPNANLYISNMLPRPDLFINNECSIVLGTDSLASNDQLSILDEINVLQKHFPQLRSAMLLQWATINGAKALGIENTFGSFEKGKKPGIVLIEEVSENGLMHSKRIL